VFHVKRKTVLGEGVGSLQAVGLAAGYGVRTVLDDVTVEIRPGTVTAIIGPNGSGKSTLLRCLAGAVPPRRGRVLLGRNTDIHQLSASDRAQHLAFVPQETPMPFAFTVEELLHLSSKPEGARGGVGAAAAHELRILDGLELGPLLSRALPALSGGERQRAAIARGLLQAGPCLLLDEPTSHLDPRHQIGLFRLLKEQAAVGRAVAVVLHDLNQAAQWADHLIGLQEGKIVLDGAMKDSLDAISLSALYQIPIRIRDVDGQRMVTISGYAGPREFNLPLT